VVHLPALFISLVYVAWNKRGIVELQRMWREAVVALFKVISQNFPGGTEESHENPHSG
jgi:hypothetical protein